MVHLRTAVVALILAAACGEGTPPVTFNVTPDGGTVSLAGGLVELVVPAGAVSQSVTVTATSTSGPSAPTVLNGTVFDLQPSITFAQPVTVKLKYGGATLPTGVLDSELGIYKAEGNAWTKVSGTTVDAAAKVVTASVSSFSTYGILGAPVGSVTVTPPTASIAVAGTTTLTAAPKDASGGALPNRPVTWTTSASNVATVSNLGVVTGVATGTASITATSEGQSGTSTVTVAAAQAPVATVTVAPSSASVAVGATTTLTATTRDASNNILTGRTVTWSTSAASVATVNSSTGVVTGVATGTATITATSEGQSGTSTITVTAAAATIIAQSNFESGGITSPMFNVYGTGTLDFPDDPTNSGQGKVVRMLFSPPSGGSVERAVGYDAPGNSALHLRYNKTFWFKGKVYFVQGTGNYNAAHNRKVVDWQGIGKPRVTLHRVGPNQELKISMVDCMNGSEQEVMDPSTGILLPDNQWHTIEIMTKTNSADNVRDGVVEVYMNGATTPTFRQATGLGWITENTGCGASPGGTSFFSYLVGFQLTINSGDPVYTDVRYWDDLVFSTARVP